MSDVIAAALITTIPSLVTLIIVLMLHSDQRGIHLMLNSQRTLLLEKLSQAEKDRAAAQGKIEGMEEIRAASASAAASTVREAVGAATKILEKAEEVAKKGD